MSEYPLAPITSLALAALLVAICVLVWQLEKNKEALRLVDKIRGHLSREKSERMRVLESLNAERDSHRKTIAAAEKVREDAAYMRRGDLDE